MFSNKLSNVSVFFLILALGFVLAACNSTASAPSESSAPPTVETAVSQKIGLLVPEKVPFFDTLQDGAKEAANRLNVELVVRDASNDINTQNEQIQEMIDLGVNAIVITAVDSQAVVEKIEAASAAGIAVFTVDRSIDSDTVVSHIASDNATGGKMAGDYLAETLGKKGNVVELEGIAGTSAAQERGAGFNAAMETYPDITIIAKETADFNREEGQTVFAQILADNPEIDGVFAHNDEMVLGAIAAAEETGRLGDIVFVGFDAVDDAVAALENGALAATI
ncbi:MAG: substrate-binding domain-containing protein, partial [Anaerolineales bacterium]|nr:substrate-binding domain-containing protein [Anaerolineales bacterium]